MTREEAIEVYNGLINTKIKEAFEFFAPELRESEDERIRKKIVDIVKASPFDEEKDVLLDWLEKQKYDRMKPIYDARESFESALEKAWNDYHNGYENVDKLEDDYVECAHAKGFREGYLFGIEKQKEPKDPFDDEQFSRGYEAGKHDALRGQVDAFVTEYNKGFDAGRLEGLTAGYNKAVKEMEQKEQKPNSTEDMPYITDERFYEREPADSFKYKLAEYMTKCCTKKEGPYGYTYGISAETILKMAEEELLKRGVVQKPAEWSEEDERKILELKTFLAECNGFNKSNRQKAFEMIDSLRPSWKPSEEQIRSLEYFIKLWGDSDGQLKYVKIFKDVKSLCEHLKNL